MYDCGWHKNIRVGLMREYTVKEFAELTHVTVRTLHYYDTTDVLKPARYDNNIRIYTDNEKMLMDCIAMYKRMGLSLEVIKDVMKSDDGTKEVKEVLRKRKYNLNNEIDELLIKGQKVDNLLYHLQKEEYVQSDAYNELLTMELTQPPFNVKTRVYSWFSHMSVCKYLIFLFLSLDSMLIIFLLISFL